MGYYILTPIIFVTFHFYMLLNLVLLARTAKSFEDALERAFPEDGDARDPTMTVVQEDEIAKLWVSQTNASPAQEVFEKALAEQWRKTGCDATGVPYFLRA